MRGLQVRQTERHTRINTGGWYWKCRVLTDIDRSHGWNMASGLYRLGHRDNLRW
jgi:hypothetical protein